MRCSPAIYRAATMSTPINPLRRRKKHHTDEFKFGLEATLRSWIKDWLMDSYWRVEPSQGSTFGLPDGFVIGPNKRTLFIELKACHLQDGRLEFGFTPAQKRSFPKLIKQGACLTVVAAETGSNRLWLLRGDEAFKDERMPYFSDSAKGMRMITSGNPEQLIPTILDLHGLKPIGRPSFNLGKHPDGGGKIA